MLLGAHRFYNSHGAKRTSKRISVKLNIQYQKSEKKYESKELAIYFSSKIEGIIQYDKIFLLCCETQIFNLIEQSGECHLFAIY